MGREVAKCLWGVSINGQNLDQKRLECIEGIDINEQCDGSDTCTLIVRDPEFLYIEDNIFIEEATVFVYMILHGDTHEVTFEGYISAIDINFPDTGSPTLSVFCLDNSHLMNRKKKKRSWDNVTNADVVQKIAQEYGFQCVVESGYEFKTEDTISQSGVTDIAFCESLADKERDPFMCKLVGDTLYYVKKGILKEESTTVYYKKSPFDVVSFRPRINKETKLEETSHADINADDKEIDSAVADDGTARDVQGEAVKTSSTPVRIFDNETRQWDRGEM